MKIMTAIPQDRVQELIRVKGRELMDNEGNWRTHPMFQREALAGLLDEVGVADALKAYYSERNGGKLTLIDGHLRKNDHPDVEWPVLVLDLDDEEADILLAFYDTTTQWAEPEPMKLDDLLRNARERLENNERLRQAAERARGSIAKQVEIARRLAEGDDSETEAARMQRALSERSKRAVKVVIPIGNELGTFEKALKKTGLKSRSDALIAICNFYLDEAPDAA
jgi:hypothetical protein